MTTIMETEGVTRHQLANSPTHFEIYICNWILGRLKTRFRRPLKDSQCSVTTAKGYHLPTWVPLAGPGYLGNAGMQVCPTHSWETALEPDSAVALCPLTCLLSEVPLCCELIHDRAKREAPPSLHSLLHNLSISYSGWIPAAIPWLQLWGKQLASFSLKTPRVMSWIISIKLYHSTVHIICEYSPLWKCKFIHHLFMYHWYNKAILSAWWAPSTGWGRHWKYTDKAACTVNIT